MLKHGILGLLNYHEMTGYEIMEVFRDSLGFFWKARTSQIYRELQTLENNRWAAKTVVPQQGKPDKNVYSITEEGKKELLQWLSNGDSGLPMRNPLLMKVFFMGERSREENIRFFKGIKAYCEKALSALEMAPDIMKAYSVYLDEREKAAYWQMTLMYGRSNMRMCAQWAQECIELLEGQESRD